VSSDTEEGRRLMHSLLDACVMRTARAIRYAIARLAMRRWEREKLNSESGVVYAYWRIAKVMKDEDLAFEPHPARGMDRIPVEEDADVGRYEEEGPMLW
jgi:hypothetical protein